MNEMKGEYKERGEYHRYLDPSWSYYDIYVKKMALVNDYITSFEPDILRILDAGCGEGVLVEKYQKLGYDIVGIDKYYKSKFVKQSDILFMPFQDEIFDVILLLDVIEHLQIENQSRALMEISRVLKKNGIIIISIPNLAHWASRCEFLLKGKLIRTANVSKHPGDRPVYEYIELIKKVNLNIIERFSIKLTMPKLQEKILRAILGGRIFNDYVYSPKRNPDFCFLNLFFLKK